MNKSKIQGLRSFLLDDIWRVTDDEVSRPRHLFYNALKIATLSVREFIENRIVNKASALTYNTLLSFIPLLAILFAIARGLGFASLMESQFRSGLEGQSQAAEIILGLIDSYLAHAKSGVFIGVGLVMLLWTIISLTNNIERTFNSIWQVKKPRSFYRKITDYLSVLLLLPVFIVLSGGITIFLSTLARSTEEFVVLAPLVKTLVRLLPFALSWIAFTALYVFIPNTRVRLRVAVVPGLLASIAFQGLQYLYIGSQIWVSRYNAIYGSFAAIPMFLLWTQLAWEICLYGAQLCYVAQNLNNFAFSKETAHISRRYHDFLCLLIMSRICQRFERNEAPYTAETLSEEHKIPIRLTKKILYELQDVRLLRETPSDADEDTIAYLPATDLQQLNVALLLRRLNVAGSENFKIDREKYSKSWEALAAAQEEYYGATAKMLLKDL
jgi:membrane protein